MADTNVSCSEFLVRSLKRREPFVCQTLSTYPLLLTARPLAATESAPSICLPNEAVFHPRTMQHTHTITERCWMKSVTPTFATSSVHRNTSGVTNVDKLLYCTALCCIVRGGKVKKHRRKRIVWLLPECHLGVNEASLLAQRRRKKTRAKYCYPPPNPPERRLLSPHLQERSVQGSYFARKAQPHSLNDRRSAISDWSRPLDSRCRTHLTRFFTGCGRYIFRDSLCSSNR